MARGGVGDGVWALWGTIGVTNPSSGAPVAGRVGETRASSHTVFFSALVCSFSWEHGWVLARSQRNANRAATCAFVVPAHGPRGSTSVAHVEALAPPRDAAIKIAVSISPVHSTFVSSGVGAVVTGS